jgi:holo-[acyl-carrier protein] synthase
MTAMRVGVDIQPVADVLSSLARFGDRYRRKLFTEREVRDSGGWGAETATAAASLAARFAAKEATFKALRVSERVPLWTDVELVREPGGWPTLLLHGLAAELAAEAGLHEFQVSISHTEETAVAMVVAIT